METFSCNLDTLATVQCNPTYQSCSITNIQALNPAHVVMIHLRRDV
jgi:hypothetical protein